MKIPLGARYAALAALPLFAGCGDYGDHCGNCSYGPPTEVSYGLVTGHFNAAGGTSVIATSTVYYQPSFNSGNLKSYLSSGVGSFAPATLTAAGTDPLYLAAADINGDGLADLVSASYDDGAVSVFINNPQAPGTFSAPLSLPSPGASQVAVADMTGDGLADIVSADYNVSLFVQTAPGAFANPVTLYSGGANWVALGDLNGDGIPDVALTDASGVQLLMHAGAAGTTTYAAPVQIYAATANADVQGANIIAIADLNGDGFNDLVITDQGPTGGAAPTVSVLYQNPAQPGQFLTPVSYPIAPGSRAQSIVVKDINGDGLPDIVIGGTRAVSVLRQVANSAGNTFTDTDYSVYDASEIGVADVNGDGLLDIVVPTGVTQATVNGVVTNNPGVLLATGPGVFAAETDLVAP